MSKDIWHTKDEIPRQESRVIWKSDNVVCGGRFDTYYKCFCGPASQFVDLRKVSRWCYLDELILENDHTRKALDVAVDALKRTDWCAQDYAIAQDALDKITALEQKDVK